MKKAIHLTLALSILITLASSAKEKSDSLSVKHEFFTSLDKPNNSFGVNYARRLSEKNWLRFGINLKGSFVYSQPLVESRFPMANFDFYPAILLGIEHHKTIKSDFEFITGINLQLITDLDYSKLDNPALPIIMQNSIAFTLNYGVGANFGIYYKISENFAIGSSLNPSIILNLSETDRYKSFSFRFYLTDVSIICLRYKI